jgi:hypothetical protein
MIFVQHLDVNTWVIGCLLTKLLKAYFSNEVVSYELHIEILILRAKKTLQLVQS